MEINYNLEGIIIPLNVPFVMNDLWRIMMNWWLFSYVMRKIWWNISLLAVEMPVPFFGSWKKGYLLTGISWYGLFLAFSTVFVNLEFLLIVFTIYSKIITFYYPLELQYFLIVLSHKKYILSNFYQKATNVDCLPTSSISRRSVRVSNNFRVSNSFPPPASFEHKNETNQPILRSIMKNV